MKRIIRRIPIDWQAIAEESGLRRGTLCRNDMWGWHVQGHGVSSVPDVGIITPPEIAHGESLRVSGNFWEVITCPKRP